MFITATVTRWQSLKDSCRRIAPLDNGTRNVLMNPSYMSEITAISTGSRFKFTDRYLDRRESPNYVEITQTPTEIATAHDIVGSETITLIIYRNNDRTKATYNITIPTNDLIYADRCNADPLGASWVVFKEGAFKITKGIALVAMSLEEILTGTSLLRDYDGNGYTTVSIGSQEWIVENLRVKTYSDGTAIPNTEDNGYGYWYLPSKDDLLEIYNMLHLSGLGGFTNTSYWSSTEFDDTTAWQLDFTTGTETAADKATTNYVRAVRYLAIPYIYNVGDVGPAGGYIFSILDLGAGWFYYGEIAPVDQSTSHAWSNIVDVLADYTLPDVLMAEVNTEIIIDQVGHTDSAAQVCVDYSIAGWGEDTTGAYCYYENNADNFDFIGLLYNWYAVDNAHGLAYFERNGAQEAGWRVPSKTDWDVLIAAIGGDDVGGGLLKEMGFVHWNAPNTGATDVYGFKAIAGGNRYIDVSYYWETDFNDGFESQGIYGDMWSSTEDPIDPNATSVFIANDGDNIFQIEPPKYAGLNVRCVRDIV